MINNERPIVIYFPSLRLGGSEILFLELFHYLCEKGNTVYIVDYADGVIANHVLPEYKDCILYEHEINSIESNEAIIISSSSHLTKLGNLDVKKGWAISILILHKFHIYNLLAFSRLYKKYSTNQFLKLLRLFEYKTIRIVSSFIDRMSHSNGLVYFNKTTYDLHQSFFSFTGEPLIVRLPFKNSNSLIKKESKLADKETIHVAWVSRLDDDLFESLKSIIHLLNDFSKEYHSLKLHVIGDGVFLDELKELKADSLEIETTGAIYGDNLYKYLYENIDIGIGRGTVNLNYSSCGIPSIIIPLPTTKSKIEKQFILGNERLDNYSDKYNLTDILNLLIKDYRVFQEKSLEDVNKYDSANIFPKILEYASNSTIQVEDVQRLVSHQPILNKIKKSIKKIANA